MFEAKRRYLHRYYVEKIGSLSLGFSNKIDHQPIKDPSNLAYQSITLTLLFLSFGSMQ
jgi:hypothetical protein